MKIAINGRMGTGKTVACNYLKEKYGGTIVSFASPLKKLALDLFDVKYKNDIIEIKGIFYTGRQIYQMLGNKLREIDPDFWVKKTIKEIVHIEKNTYFKPSTPNIYNDDMRFENEQKCLKSSGFVIVKLFVNEETRFNRLKERDGYIPPNHVLNACGENIEIEYDYAIDNSYNTHELFRSLDKIVKETKNGFLDWRNDKEVV